MQPEKSLTALKTLVVSMGIVLVVGFLVVMAAAWMKMKATSAQTVASNCKGGDVDLKGRGTVIDTNYNGNILRIVLAKPDGEVEVAQIDLCTGKQVGSVKIATDMVQTER